MTRSPRPLAVLAAVLALLLAACGSDDGGASGGGGDPTSSALSGEITVSAAASLTDVYTEIGQDFEDANPGTTVRFNFDSSGTLSDQIISGAPVDVFASADEANMTKLTDEDLVDGEPTIFARNELVIVTRPGNPEGIESLEDLADVGIVSLCGEDAPCGTFAGQVLDAAGVEIPESRVTRGQNVRATLAAVAEGDAPVGIVYVTDAVAAGDTVDTVVIPEDRNVIVTYPIGVLRASGEAELARAFLDFVASDDGQRVLEEYGFLGPA